MYKDQLQETREEKNDLVTHLERNLEEERTNVKELEDRLFGVHQVLQLTSLFRIFFTSEFWDRKGNHLIHRRGQMTRRSLRES